LYLRAQNGDEDAFSIGERYTLSIMVFESWLLKPFDNSLKMFIIVL